MKGQQATEHQKQPASDDNDDDWYRSIHKSLKTLLNLSKGEKAASSAAKKPFSFSTHHQTWQGKDTANNFFFKEIFWKEINDFLWLASVLSVPIAAENPGDYKKKIGGFAPRKWGICGEGGEAEAVTENSKYLQQKRFSIKFTDGLDHSSCQMMSPEEVLTIGGKICLKLDK